mmetsp:Transcript_6112/g.12679  ORF Transcript_6112/g.12679 Transcript_6112/m.12679 type:complete len:626 (-) Transcript_6112:58-1935(-)|eukprot:CAMPEP_0197546046 /NCGR_PEP_ID=MMETSP1320-20131121/825_1 /TAXON_ID=91990 /ORGANISM="Bolidomonas sp., Strain RCC2347" /LENGTH=625 /DNA_ID=CAMNT_0043105593 /DNA_START=355 /DNA_END=2232 /DNA_ORIENTATION=-
MSQFTQAVNVLSSPSLVRTLPPLPTTERGKNVTISCNPSDPDQIIYCSGKSVVVRRASDPYGSGSYVYRGHQAACNVAKFSRNGNYVASGDASGKVRVWAANVEDKRSKLELQVLGGPITDLAWDGESKKIVVCGDGGSGLHVKCFIWDSGNNCGEFVGHNKRATTVDYKPTRPFRIMSGSEDFKTVFYSGPPFKRTSDSTPHTNYVNCLRYSPCGSYVASCGSDKRVALHDGAVGSVLKASDEAHSGSVYALAWAKEADKIVTCGADKKVKVMSVPELSVEGCYELGSELSDFAVGCCAVAEGEYVAVTLDGRLHVLGKEAYGPGPGVTIGGHQGGITCMDVGGGKVVTGGSDGNVAVWDLDKKECSNVTGGASVKINKAVHSGAVSTVDAFDSGDVVSCGWDDVARFTAGGVEAGGEVPLGGQPKASGSGGGVLVVATKDRLTVVEGKEVKGGLDVDYVTCSVAVSPDGTTVTTGDSGSKIRVYGLSGGSLAEQRVIDAHSGGVWGLAFNRDGSKLASGDVKEVNVWNTEDWSAERTNWTYHTSRICCLDWSPDGSLLASAGTDESVFIWSLRKKLKRVQFKFAHKGGVVGARWLEDGRLVTAGADGCVVEWDTKQVCDDKFK